jgi:hypothetical protein
MSAQRVVKFGPSCMTSDGLFQVVKLSDGKYALLIGNIRVVLGGVLPMEPPKGVSIDYYDDQSEVRRAWEDNEDGFESSGDHQSVANLEGAWPESSLMQIE